MARKIDLALIILQSVILFMVLEWMITPFALIPGIVAAFASTIKRGSSKGDAEIAVFAKDVLRNYKLGLLGSIEAAADHGYSFSKLISVQARRFRLGSYQIEETRTGDRRLTELLKILSYGVSTGSSVKSNIEGFCKRIDGSINKSNRIVSKIGNTQSVSFLSISFFLPLFGGISSSILVTSLGLVGQGSVALQHDFLYNIASYILIVILIGTFINRPTLPLLDNLYAVVRTFSVSMLVMAASAIYIGYAV